MAAAIKNPARKLYFDVQFNTAVTNVTVLCTPYTSSCIGDRFGSLITPLQAFTGSSPARSKQAAEVGAWFVPSHGGSGEAGTHPFICRFVQPTGGAANCLSFTTGLPRTGAGLALNSLAFLTVGGTVVTKNGNSAVFAGANASSGVTRHFGVQVSKGTGSLFTGGGVLHVERSHTIEV